MAPKGASDTTAPAGKTFSESTVAVILMALGTTSISNKQYEMMSAMDGQKTASAFQHQFRSVLKLAKELKQRAEEGESFGAVAPAKKRSMYSSLHYQDASKMGDTRQKCLTGKLIQRGLC
jgi:hypothetical protein